MLLSVILAALGITVEARGDRSGALLLVVPALIVCSIMAFMAMHARA